MATTGRLQPPAVLVVAVAVAALCAGVASGREWPPRIDHFGRKRSAAADRMDMFRSATFGKRFGAGQGNMLSASFGKRFGTGSGGMLSASFGKRYAPVQLSNGKWPGAPGYYEQ